MNLSTNPLPVPRRTFLASTGLTLLVAMIGAPAKAAPSRYLGSTTVTISGEGDAFRRVVAHFALPDGSSTPFYAWDRDASSISFTMPLSTQGLRLSVEGSKAQELTLEPGAALGTHVLKHDGSELRITVAAA
ncbi:hypothetical protein [Armatimonas sp.]|uniref:hypothetical protein n=1 Tax=Armatimonas sp. TaxID=1872638 RepID=UPI00286A084C|nr:hypothetical protein [Armatimonas sp.]